MGIKSEIEKLCVLEDKTCRAQEEFDNFYEDMEQRILVAGDYVFSGGVSFETIEFNKSTSIASCVLNVDDNKTLTNLERLKNKLECDEVTVIGDSVYMEWILG